MAGDSSNERRSRDRAMLNYLRSRPGFTAFFFLGLLVVLLLLVHIGMLIFDFGYGNIENTVDLASIMILVSLALIGAMSLFIPLFDTQADSTAEIKADIRTIQTQIEESAEEEEVSPIERRGEKLLQLRQRELDKYYSQTRGQGRYIFWVGIFCIIGGFSIIGYTLRHVTSNESASLGEQIVVATLGGVGGLLSNFIAVIYLRMFGETRKSLNEFHDRLVVTHHLQFGNYLASKITDDGLRERTLATMATSLAPTRGAPIADAQPDGAHPSILVKP